MPAKGSFKRNRQKENSRGVTIMRNIILTFLISFLSIQSTKANVFNLLAATAELISGVLKIVVTIDSEEEELDNKRSKSDHKLKKHEVPKYLLQGGK